MLTKISAPLVRTLIHRELRKSLRRVCWIGAIPELPEEVPVIVYANHNHFLDGHLLWLAARVVFQRPFLIWMEELHRFPFFASQGALAFPENDSASRSATIRKTRSLFASSPPPLLAYFPGGALSRPEAGLPDENPRTFRRLDRIMSPTTWLPLAIHVTWWGESLPTALLAAGDPHTGSPGDEMQRLGTVLDVARSPDPMVTQTLVEGRRGPNEIWNLSFLRRLYRPC